MPKVKLQHAHRAGPDQFVLVNGTRYELDAEGVIEASEKDAEKLLAGSKWRAEGQWGERVKVDLPTPSPIKGAGRRVRTREEMLGAADVSGIPVAPEPAQAPQAAPVPQATTEAPAELMTSATEEPTTEVETIEISGTMTKTELLALAQEAGIKVNRNMSKADILAAFEEGA